ncbi:MAG: inositol monophosphatase family protein, partial [Mycobacteriales bacterium]
MMSTLSLGAPDVAPADDQLLAIALAEEAGSTLMALREELGYADPKALRGAGDRGAQALLARRLAAARPDDAVLSEEAADVGVRETASRVWIIDPLDGTREYSEEGRTDWAVHVALWERGVLTAGAVALPARGVTLSTANPPAMPGGRPDGLR